VVVGYDQTERRKWLVRLPGSEDVGVFFGGIVWSLQGTDRWFRRSSTDETTVGERSSSDRVLEARCRTSRHIYVYIPILAAAVCVCVCNSIQVKRSSVAR